MFIILVISKKKKNTPELETWVLACALRTGIEEGVPMIFMPEKKSEPAWVQVLCDCPCFLHHKHKGIDPPLFYR